MATNQSLGRNQRLQSYCLTGVKETGAEIGRGSYAVVVELRFKGLKCVGKKLYPHLYNGVGMLQRFEEECDLLAQARHPNIVQFLGVTFEEGTHLPTIIMEFMHTTLSACIDRYGALPQEISYCILNDVATALCYLHGSNPQIIHRDLTANNVLLTRDMNAKISDLGVAKILNVTPARMLHMTTCPGTPAYMPPESLEHNPTYATSIDSFSFGVTMVHLLSGKWPIPSSATIIDPLNPNQITPRTEAERRQTFLDDIGEGHPLMRLILGCLSNNPSYRPSAEDILQRVNAAAGDYPPSYVDKIVQITAESQQQQDIDDLCKQMNEFHQKYKSRYGSRKQTETAHSKLRDKTIQVPPSGLIEEDQLQTAVNFREMEQKMSATQKELELKISQLEKEQAKLINPFSTDSQLKWAQAADLPVAMGTAQCVTMGTDLYVGGGGVDDNNDGQLFRIYNYCSIEKLWHKTVPSPQCYFGLACIQGKPATVGGISSYSNMVTGKISIYEKSNDTWTECKSVPCMPTPRLRVCAVSTDDCIIACGGFNRNNECVNTVEIFLHKTNQWCSATSLPASRAGLRCAIIRSKAYFMGGYYPTMRLTDTTKNCFCVNLDSIQPNKKIQLAWKSLADLPFPGCAPANMCGALMAFGAEKQHHGVYFYEPNSKQWIRISNLPQYRFNPGAAVLSNNQLVLVGGWDTVGRRSSTFIGTIEKN